MKLLQALLISLALVRPFSKGFVPNFSRNGGNLHQASFFFLFIKKSKISYFILFEQILYMKNLAGSDLRSALLSGNPQSTGPVLLQMQKLMQRIQTGHYPQTVN